MLVFLLSRKWSQSCLEGSRGSMLLALPAVICKCPRGPAVSMGGSRIIFSHQCFPQRAIRSSLEKQLDPSVQLLLKGVRTRMSYETYTHVVTCDFKGVRTPCPPSPPLWIRPCFHLPLARISVKYTYLHGSVHVIIA